MARKASVERAAAKIGGFATSKKNITVQYQGADVTGTAGQQNTHMINSFLRKDPILILSSLKYTLKKEKSKVLRNIPCVSPVFFFPPGVFVFLRKICYNKNDFVFS